MDIITALFLRSPGALPLRLAMLLTACAALAASGAPQTAGGVAQRGLADPKPGPSLRLPAEFEPQAALVVSAGQLVGLAPRLLGEVLAATAGRVPVIGLTRDASEAEQVAFFLADAGLAAGDLRLLEVIHDTPWVRDHGGLLVETADGAPAWADAIYSEPERWRDDSLPTEMADRFGIPLLPVPLVVDGGHLISNGEGLIVTARSLLEENPGAPASHVRDTLARAYGAEEVLFLEPLAGESTGHVDLFATFVTPDTVLVGSADPLEDPQNAAILDDNAAQLAAVTTRRGPLRVVRVPMPPRDEGAWRTHLNLVMANGVVLVPCHDTVPADTCDRTRHVLATLLPDWSIVRVEASEVERLGGALHCLVLHLPALGPSRAPAGGPTTTHDGLRGIAGQRI